MKPPKTEEEWKKKLTPEEYAVLRKKTPKGRISASMINFGRPVFTFARVAGQNFFLPKRSLMLAAAGPAFTPV